MDRRILLLLLILFFLSGCTEPSTTYPPGKQGSVSIEEPRVTDTIGPNDIVRTNQTNATLTGILVKEHQSDLLIDRISEDLNILYDKKWSSLYQADELDCSRMSTYLWKYLRDEYRIAPKIIASYERQHAWLAVKVSDVGNSTNYQHWNIRGIEYYYLESTLPKVVVDDNQKFVINNRPYTSTEFYNAPIYVFDTPQDANDFHAGNSILGGWNQEFRLKKDDVDKIEKLLNSSND